MPESALPQTIMPTALPSIGLVIGTFAAVPYIHLHLESRARYYPHVPILVHDDGSPRRNELQTLCERYGADFISRPTRARPTIGDLSAFVAGFDWAHERRFSLLVKMSRRFVPFHNWTPELLRLAAESQHATYSHRCLHFSFGFRTECIAMHVPTWRNSGAVDKMRQIIARNSPTFVEGVVHNMARAIQKSGICEANKQYVAAHPQPPEADGYTVWPIMNDKRTSRKADVLWHDCDGPIDYCRTAVFYRLDYKLEDFLDPNQGHGAGT